MDVINLYRTKFMTLCKPSLGINMCHIRLVKFVKTPSLSRRYPQMIGNFEIKITHWFPAIRVQAGCDFCVDARKGTRLTSDFASACPQCFCSLIDVIGAHGNLKTKNRPVNNPVIMQLWAIGICQSQSQMTDQYCLPLHRKFQIKFQYW